jgi:alkylhydroperoxidase family enzyme
MARLPYIRPDDIPPEYADIAARKINIYGIAAHSLDCARAFGAMGKFIRHASKLDARLRELAIIQVGYYWRSAYEFYHHVKIGYQFGLTDADVLAMIAATDHATTALSALDQAALRMTRQMCHDGKVDAETYAIVAAALPREHLVDLVMTVSYYNGVVRFLGCFEVDLEPGYEALAEKYPLPAYAHSEKSAPSKI